MYIMHKLDQKPRRTKIIEPVIKVKTIDIIGTKKFIRLELCERETIDGNKLFIFSTHQ